MEKQWQMGDEGLAEAFESLPQEEQMRLAAEMDRRLEHHTNTLRAQADEMERRNEALRDLLKRRREFVERLKRLRDEVRAEDEAFRRESERLLAA